MNDQDIENLIKKTPTSQLNIEQASKLLYYLHTKNDPALIKQDYFELSLKHHLYKRCIDLLNLKEDIAQQFLPQLFALLGQANPLGQEFNFLVLFCTICFTQYEITNNSPNIENLLPNISTANVEMASILIISYLSYFSNLISNNNIANEQIKAIIDSFVDETIPPYKYVEFKFGQLIQNFLDSIDYSKIEEAASIFESQNLIQRINELNNGLIEQIKSMPKYVSRHKNDEFLSSFNLAVDNLEQYLNDNLLPKVKLIRRSAAQCNHILYQISSLPTELSYVKSKILSPFLNDITEQNAQTILNDLKDVCIRFSNETNLKFEFTTSDISFIFLIYAASLINLYLEATKMNRESDQNRAISKLKGLFDAIENISDKLKADVHDLAKIERIACISANLNNPTNEIYLSVHHSADSMLLAVHFSECSYLESIIKNEIILFSEQSSFYPKSSSAIFTRLINKRITEESKLSKVTREQLFQDILDRFTSFATKLRLLPGIRKDTIYSDFIPSEKFPWPKFPKPNSEIVTFPTEPEEVRKILKMRTDIYQLIDDCVQSQDAPFCLHCQKNYATKVCPNCKKLVICNECVIKIHKCPVENCDYVFANLDKFT